MSLNESRRSLTPEELEIAIAHAMQVHELAEHERARLREATDMRSFVEILEQSGLPPQDIQRAIETLPAALAESNPTPHAVRVDARTTWIAATVGGVAVLAGVLAFFGLRSSPEAHDAGPMNDAESVLSSPAAASSSPLAPPSYPGATDVRQSARGDETKVYFRSSDDLGDVFAFFDGWLGQEGWTRTKMKTEADEIEADYERAGEKLEVELEREGTDRYELELELER